MKQRIVLFLFAGLMAFILSSYSGGYGQNGGDDTGASGASGGCSCHNSTTSLGTKVELDSAGIPVTSYHPGVAYTVKISGTNNTTHTTLKRFGFQLATVKATGAGSSSAVQAGTWGTMPASVQNTTAAVWSGGTPNFSIIEQSSAILDSGSTTGGVGSRYIESIPWTAPAAGTGSIKIYGIINAVNFNNSSSGDYAQVATPVTITEAVATSVVASVSIALTSGTNPTCAGSSVTFTATPTNGGTAPTYQWKVNGTAVGGATASTFTSTTLATGSVVTCVMTSNLGGVTGSPATSNAITMTINPTVTPSVSISTPNTTICAGSSATFTATPTNGGTTPSYQWKVNGTNAGTNSATFTTSTLTNGQIVTCVMTSNAACPTTTTATSTGITMTVNPAVTPSVSITTPNTTVCSGSSVTFTATPTNGGTPSYQWKVNGTNAGTNSATFTTTSLTNGAVVTCVMTSTASCASPTTATSNAITMTISSAVTPSVSISTPTTSICPNASVTFTATPTNGGTTPSYQWKVNGVNAGTNSPTFTTTTLTNGQVVTCVMTSSSACASPTTGTSNALTMSVATQTPTITISNTPGTHCSGTADTFTAVETNGGTSPIFQWKVNGTNVGTNSSSFISSSITNGQSVTCVLTSSLACASPASVTSNSVTAVIVPTVTPTLSITTPQPTVCQGANTPFTASGTNLGTAPTYQWQINGTNTGSGTASFSTTSLANGNTVNCIVTSNAACASPSQAFSNTLTMNVTAAPSVTVTPSGPVSLCAGDSIRLTAGGASSYQWTTADTTASIWIHFAGQYSVIGSNGTCSAAATTPAVVTVNTPSVPTVTQSGNVITSSAATGYQWILNGTPISGATAQSYTITQSGNYMVTTRDANGCYATSIHYIFTYVNGIASIGCDLGVKLYPIPNQGSFMVDAAGLNDADLAIYNVYGQKMFEQKLSAGQTQISSDLAPALYFVTISEGGKTQTIKMQILRD